jgi:hypothetical protein
MNVSYSYQQDLLFLLYESLCNEFIDTNSAETIQVSILKYLEDCDISLNYIVMDHAISNWVRNITMTLYIQVIDEIPPPVYHDDCPHELDFLSVPVNDSVCHPLLDPVFEPVDLPIPGLLVLVYQNNGSAVYDSFFKETNKKSEGFRSYIIGCNVSPEGVSFFKKYNKDSCKLQLFIAVRQGISPNDSLGTIVIGMNIE